VGERAVNYTNIVTMTINKPPKGWPETLTLTQYEKLDDERKKYYHPTYDKYRTKKVRDYDFDTGEFVGWKPIQIGLGAVTGYEYVGYYAAKEIDAILNSNVLMQRILKK
jgi:hypothetical protein